MSLLGDLIKLHNCLTIDDHYENLTLEPPKNPITDPFIFKGAFVCLMADDGGSSISVLRSRPIIPCMYFGRDYLLGPLNLSIRSSMILDDEGGVLAILRGDCYVLPKDFF